jgi:hypothetical protein
MNKQVTASAQTAKGIIETQVLGDFKLHAYKTNDFISDTVFLLEKDGEMIIIEQPCFLDNIKELSKYIKSSGAKVRGKILPYHMAGGTFLPEAAVYATQKAADYGHTGGGKNLIGNFAAAFGAAFDSSISKVTDIIKEGNVKIGNFNINIIGTPEAFDIEFPQINAVYTHMLGADTHSIIAGKEHADALITQFKSFIAKKYDIILSSHHMPENIKDVEIKISYLEKIKEIAAHSQSAQDFKSGVKKAFSGYHGDNYLDMTAGFFFPEK